MRNWRYKKLCETDIFPSAVDDFYVEELLYKLSNLPSRSQSFLPAGYTYFGQLIDHDLSFLRQTEIDPSKWQETLAIEKLKQARRPALDLDTIYGSGLDDSAVPYDLNNGKFDLGQSIALYGQDQGKQRDLPRDASGRPKVADERNDQHLLISQMQVLWMRFHNKIVDHYLDEGFAGPDVLFALARKEVVHVYRHVVLHDFAFEILPRTVYDEVIAKPGVRLSKPSKTEPELPIEFAAAAFRWHSMVRSGYRVNGNENVTLDEMFEFTGNSKKTRFLVPEKLLVDWRHFFESDAWGESFLMNRAEPLSTRVERFTIKDASGCKKEHVMARSTIKRGLQLGLASGEELLAWLQVAPRKELAQKLELKEHDFSTYLGVEEGPFKGRTPLWVYLMLEAGGSEGKTHKLGPMGGWLVADTLKAAASSVEPNLDSDWQPKISVLRQIIPGDKDSGYSRNRITLADIVQYVYLDGV